MAFNKTQIEFIDSIVEDEIDFSDDFFEFKQELLLLKETLNRITQTTATRFSNIQNFLLTPEKFFLRLETMGLDENTLTLGDVRAAIFNKINQLVNAHAAKLYYPLTTTEWHMDSTLNSKSYEDDAKLFVSDASNIIFSNDLTEMPRLNHKIYEREVVFHERHVGVDGVIFSYVTPVTIVTVKLDNKTIKFQLSFQEFSNNFDNYNDQEDYFYKLKKQIDQEILNHVANHAIRRLFEITYSKEVYKLPKEIVTHSIYHHLFLYDLLSVKTPIEERSVHQLLKPGIPELIADRVLNIQSAMTLRPLVLQTICHPVFYGLLKSRTISFQQLNDLEDKRLSFLMYPPITNLIQQQKITFYRASRLPIELKPIFAMAIYQNYFRKTTGCNWPSVTWHNPELFRYLQDKNIADLITSDIIDFIDVRLMSEDQYEVVRSEPIHTLLKEGIIDYAKACCIQSFILDYLQKYPQLIHWLRSSFTTMLDVEIYDITSLTAKVFGSRLFAIFCDKPFNVSGAIDTVDAIMAGVESAAKTCDLTEDKMLENILHQLLENLHEHFKINEAWKLPKVQAYFEMIQTTLADYHKRPQEAEISFKFLQKIANDFLKDYTKERRQAQTVKSDCPFGTLYNHVYHPAKKQKIQSMETTLDQFKYICERLKSLAPLTDSFELEFHYKPGLKP